LTVTLATLGVTSVSLSGYPVIFTMLGRVGKDGRGVWENAGMTDGRRCGRVSQSCSGSEGGGREDRAEVGYAGYEGEGGIELRRDGAVGTTPDSYAAEREDARSYAGGEDLRS
jgi:hypothetical protein